MIIKSILFVISAATIMGCSSRNHKAENQPAPAPTSSPSTTPSETALSPAVAQVAAAQVPDDHKETSSSVHSHSDGVAPDQAFTWLKNGNKRFTKGFLRKDGQSGKDIARLSKGQKPHTIVLSCSDSRVPPELVFDQKLGEIFVVRTAGQSLDNNAIGSIEYAVEHLGARAILVMGHTSCGAVKAALSTMGGGDAGSPALNHLVGDLHPRLRQFSKVPQSSDVAKESTANTQGVAADLLLRSKILSAAAQSGKISIKTALYYIENGRVEFD